MARSTMPLVALTGIAPSWRRYGIGRWAPRRVRFLSALLACGGILLSSPSGSAAQEPPAWVEEESLVPMICQRQEAVQVEGARLPALLGRRLEDIRVYSSRGNRLEPIAFQLDERDRKGRFVFPDGPERTVDPDPGLDGNDVLLFMARDLGRMVYAPQTEQGESFALTLKVTDPRDGSSGWAYVLCSPTPTPPCPEVCVRYTVKEGKYDRVDTPYYSILYPWGAYYANALVLHNAAGGRAVDLLDRFKARGTYPLFLSLFPFRSTEQEMPARLVGVRAGPIRVVRRIEYGTELGLGVRSLRFAAESLYDETHLSGALTDRVPARLDPFLKLARAEVATDFNHHAYGMLFKNSRNPEGAVIDGRMSPQESSLDLEPDEWRLVTGPQGTLFRESLPGKDSASRAEVTLAYEDNIQLADGPEGEAGLVGCVRDRAETADLESGLFKTDAGFLIAPEYRPGDESMYLHWRSVPLQVEVEDLAASE